MFYRLKPYSSVLLLIDFTWNNHEEGFVRYFNIGDLLSTGFICNNVRIAMVTKTCTSWVTFRAPLSTLELPQKPFQWGEGIKILLIHCLSIHKKHLLFLSVNGRVEDRVLHRISNICNRISILRTFCLSRKAAMGRWGYFL